MFLGGPPRWLGGCDIIEASVKVEVVRCSRRNLFGALVLVLTEGRRRATLVLARLVGVSS